MRISDWSSDVCSSDLSYREAGGALYPSVEGASSATRSRNGSDHGGSDVSGHFQAGVDEIGRASCRERVCPVRGDLGGRRIIKKTNKEEYKYDRSAITGRHKISNMNILSDEQV